jgi:hypothetical protein
MSNAILGIDVGKAEIMEWHVQFTPVPLNAFYNQE